MQSVQHTQPRKEDSPLPTVRWMIFHGQKHMERVKSYKLHPLNGHPAGLWRTFASLPNLQETVFQFLEMSRVDINHFPATSSSRSMKTAPNHRLSLKLRVWNKALNKRTSISYSQPSSENRATTSSHSSIHIHSKACGFLQPNFWLFEENLKLRKEKHTDSLPKTRLW